MNMKKTKKFNQDFYSVPIATPLNTKVFEEPAPPCLLLLNPPALPILSPLPPSPQKKNLHNIETVATEPNTQTTEQQILYNDCTIEQEQQQLYNSNSSIEQNTQDQFFLHQQNIETYQPQMFTTDFLTNTPQTQQDYTEQNYSSSQQDYPEHLGDILFPNVEVNGNGQTEPEIMETISDVINSSEQEIDFFQPSTGIISKKEIHQTRRTGKDISLLKKHYEKEEEEEEEEEEKDELRTTTKNNKRFHRYLIFKKKDEILKKFPILSQKNSDLIVTAENKFKELKSIFVLKKKYIEKNKELKEHIFGLELIEHRYRCETDRLDKKKKKENKIF